MMHSNAKQGFTLIEAMLAMTIASLIIAPIFVLEETLFTNVARVAERFQQFLFAQQFLFQARIDQVPHTAQFTLEKREEKPVTFLKYSLDTPTHAKLKSIKHLHRERVEAREKERGTPSVTLLTFRYISPKPPEEKTKAPEEKK